MCQRRPSNVDETTYHEKRRNNPVDKDAKEQLPPYLPVRKQLVQRLVSHLAQDGIHHDQQTDGCLVSLGMGA